MRKFLPIFVGVFVILNTSLNIAWAQTPDTLMINSQHSSVEFEISFMSVSKVKGRFANFGGHFQYDDKNQSIAGLEVSIDMASINTFDKARDKHLLGPDFFDSKRFPTIRFIQNEKNNPKNNKGELLGELIIKGVSNPTTLKIEYLGVREDSQGRKSYFWSGRAKIKRSDFGLHWNKLLTQGEYVLGDEIDISVSVEANLTHAIPPFSRFFALDREERKSLSDKEKNKEKKNQRPEKTNVHDMVNYQEYLTVKDQRDYFLKERESLLTENKTLREIVSSKRIEEKSRQRNDWVLMRQFALVIMIFILLGVSILYAIKLKRNPEIYANIETDKKSFLWNSALDLMMMGILLCLSVFLFFAEN